ncbi:hypothetical protein [Cellulosimicrobium sp. CUA-896]|uniref:hypothetical protein n=1 Tax=Cellulosimicrobium sp. CUA-896 TaxID=1517881 RepID=UPI002101398F|nr:hypothetical protein [Cellulosimicrobium sp. CUA-896]
MLDTWDAAVAAERTAEGRLLAVFDALDAFRSRPLGSRWCAFLGSAAEFVDPPAEVERAIRTDTETLRARLVELAAAVDPRRADELAEQLLLVVSGYLAMRLRVPGTTTRTARAVARTLVAGT